MDAPQINLIPRPVRVAKLRRRHIRSWITAAAVSFLALTVSAGMNWVARARASEAQATKRQIQAELVKARSNFTLVSAEADAVRLQIDRAKALRSKRAWSGMFALIDLYLPERAWLVSVATDPAQPQRGAPNRVFAQRGTDSKPSEAIVIDAPRMLRIAGFAVNVADPHDFVARLKSTQLFSEVILERSQREPVLDGSYFRFEVTCGW